MQTAQYTDRCLTSCRTVFKFFCALTDLHTWHVAAALHTLLPAQLSRSNTVPEDLGDRTIFALSPDH